MRHQIFQFPLLAEMFREITLKQKIGVPSEVVKINLKHFQYLHLYFASKLIFENGFSNHSIVKLKIGIIIIKSY